MADLDTGRAVTGGQADSPGSRDRESQESLLSGRRRARTPVAIPDMVQPSVDRLLYGVDIRETQWMQQGRCTSTDPEVFFPETDEEYQNLDYIKALCARCPVLDACREYAMDHGISDGVWGGTTASWRKRERTRRNKEAELWSA